MNIRHSSLTSVGDIGELAYTFKVNEVLENGGTNEVRVQLEWR